MPRCCKQSSRAILACDMYDEQARVQDALTQTAADALYVFSGRLRESCLRNSTAAHGGWAPAPKSTRHIGNRTPAHEAQ